MEVAHAIQRGGAVPAPDVAKSEKTAEADKEAAPEKASAKDAGKGARKDPVKVAPGGTRIEAVALSGQSGVFVYDCFTGGKQVNFQKNMDSSWVEYTLDVAQAGTYGLVLTAATPNFDQVREVRGPLRYLVRRRRMTLREFARKAANIT